MNQLQATVVLDERTVQKVARGEIKSPRMRTPKRATPLTIIKQLDPLIVELIANVPISHVQVLDVDKVIIWNHGPPWP